MRALKKIPVAYFIFIILFLFCSSFSLAQNKSNNDTAITNDNDSASFFQDKSDNNGMRFQNLIIIIGTEKMFGNTTYQIGYPVTDPDGTTYAGYFPFSELEWPLDIWLIKIEAAFNISETLQTSAELKKSLNDPGDKMKDSDWITSSDPNQLDVYSESDISKFDATICDFDVEWTFIKRKQWSAYAGLGYQYQKFEYSAKLIRQYSPSGIPGFDANGDGQVGITYEIMYSIPYLIIGSYFKIYESIIIDGNLALSPFTQAKDEDNHLLRENGGKISKGSMEGNAFMIDISAEYKFTQSCFLDWGIQYNKIKVSGDQKQVYGNGEKIGTVREKSESIQTSIYLSAGYKF